MSVPLLDVTKASTLPFLPFLPALRVRTPSFSVSGAFESAAGSVGRPVRASVLANGITSYAKEGSICRLQRPRRVRAHARTGDKGREKGRKGTRAKWAVLQRRGRAGIASISYTDAAGRVGAAPSPLLRLMLPHRTEINAQYFTHAAIAAACPKCLTRFGPPRLRSAFPNKILAPYDLKSRYQSSCWYTSKAQKS